MSHRTRLATLLRKRRWPAAIAALTAAAGVAVVPGTAYADAPPPAGRVPSYVAALQPNAYYCGPAATRIALSAHGVLPSFDDLAGALGTTQSGTASIFEVTRVLNGVYGYARYTSVEMSNRTVTARQVKKMRSDVIVGVNQGDPIVANVKGTITNTAGEVHSYNGGHYLTITGYANSGDLVTVTDPADAVGSNEYQVPIRVMANWVATRGYTY
jgi:hypothetical protein